MSSEFDTSVPTPLDRGSRLPDFPVDVLPRVVANMVREVAEATQTDPGMSGAVALGVMATAVGGDVEVHVKTGYFEPTNLFVAVVARPGERKSAVCTAMTAPLVDLERELVQNTRSLIIQQQMRKDIANKHAEGAKKTAGTADAANRADTTTEAVAAAQHADDIMVAAVPQIIADDITLEALGQRLAAQGGRLAIVSPEGGFLATAAGRYNKANPDLSILLKAHAGDRIRVDRINRGTDFVEQPALTVMMMVQPGVLSEASRNNSRFHDSGLLPRFLFVVPPSRLGHRDINSPGQNLVTTAAYAAHVISIARESRATNDRHVLTLDAAAELARQELDRWVETRLGRAGELADLSDWASKLVGATVRLAGLIHVFSRETEGRVITVESMRGAIKLAEYFLAHAMCAFDIMAGRDAELEPARRVLGLIGRTKGPVAGSTRHLNPHWTEPGTCLLVPARAPDPPIMARRFHGRGCPATVAGFDRDVVVGSMSGETFRWGHHHLLRLRAMVASRGRWVTLIPELRALRVDGPGSSIAPSPPRVTPKPEYGHDPASGDHRSRGRRGPHLAARVASGARLRRQPGV